MPPEHDPADRRERGQSTAEYVGVIVLIATVIALLSTSGLGEEVARFLRDAVGDISGG